MIALLVAVWVLNAIDLLCTTFAHAFLEFIPYCEANPIAAGVMGRGPVALTVFKVGLVGAGSVPLAIHRQLRLVEVGAGGIVVVYTLVAVQWLHIYGDDWVRESARVLGTW